MWLVTWNIKKLLILLIRRTSDIGMENIFIYSTASICGIASNLKTDLDGLIPFRKLGHHAKKDGANIVLITMFLEPIFHSDMGMEKVRDFLNVLDYEALGKQAQCLKAPLRYLAVFIDGSLRAGLPRQHLTTFCDNLNFAELGQQTHTDAVHLGLVYLFMEGISEVGVAKQKIHAFCQEIDFGSLGQQYTRDLDCRVSEAREQIDRKRYSHRKLYLHCIPLIRALHEFYLVEWFLRIAIDAGIQHDQILSFCMELDFIRLGRSASKHNVELACVWDFLLSISTVRVPHNKVYAFCKELEIRRLLERIVDNKQRQSHLKLLELTLLSTGLSRNAIDRLCLHPPE